MELTFVVPVVMSAVFGLVVAGFYLLIGGVPPNPPWPWWRTWLALAWVLACLCYIVLFGPIKV